MNRHTFPLSFLGVTNEYIIRVCLGLCRFLVYILAYIWLSLLVWKISWLIICLNNLRATPCVMWFLPWCILTVRWLLLSSQHGYGFTNSDPHTLFCLLINIVPINVILLGVNILMLVGLYEYSLYEYSSRIALWLAQNKWSFLEENIKLHNKFCFH
jgi:hypothetical protein